MTPIKKFWRTDIPSMQFPVQNLRSLVELLRGYMGVLIPNHDIIITSPTGKQWRLPKGMPIERRNCIKIETRCDLNES